MTIEVVAPRAFLIQTNLNGTIIAVQDDPDNPDENYLTASVSENTILRANFESTTYALTSGSGLQSFKVYLRRTNNSARVPTVTIALYEQGSLKATLVTDQAVNSTTGELLILTWDALTLSELSGDNVEINITGTVSDGPELEKNTIEIGAILWSADISVPAGTWITPDIQSNSWATISANEDTNWNAASNQTERWNLRSVTEITNVIIEDDKTALKSIVWNASAGTVNVTVDAPYIEGGIPPFSYEWQMKNGSALMENSGLYLETLSLSYQANPLQSEHDIAVEEWAVNVTDSQRSRYSSNICEVELDIYRGTMPLMDVSISSSEYNLENIVWNAVSGSSSVIIAAPVITGGFGPLSYSWQRLSGDTLITEAEINGSTLNLSYADDPSQDQSLSAAETWAVTVSDGYGSSLQSNACSVTLELYRETEPISVVFISSTASNSENILWDAADGTAIITIAAPVVTGGFGALSYQWNRISADGAIVEGVTTSSTLYLSYTANPDEGDELSAEETWSVTVTDSMGSVLMSNSCAASLAVARAWSPITNVTIQSTASDVDNIAWNALGGGANVIIAAPVITNGRAPYSYLWNRVSADSDMVEGSTTGSTLALSYAADPAEGATLTAAETWAVTVTDFNGAFLTSGNVAITLDIIKSTEPISDVSIAGTATDTANIAWNAANGTANVTIAAPVITGGFGALSYQWNRVSADSAIVEGLTTSSTLDLSYTADPSEGASLSASEAWSVTVTDSRGSVLSSNNSIVTLDVARTWSPITNVSIQATANDSASILWDDIDGTASVVVAAPIISNGRAPYTYQWNRVSADGLMTNGSTTSSTLALSYTADPLEDQTLASTETWTVTVTVTDFNDVSLTSGNVVATLDVFRATEPISVVTIAATATDSSNILWDDLDGTVSAIISAPTITGGVAPYTYQWNLESGDGLMTNGSTTGDSLMLSYTADPAEGASLSSEETWSVTVTDSKSSFMTSGNSVVTLDVARDWSPITNVTIAATASDAANIAWDDVNGTASAIIAAPTISNGRAPYTYLWSRVSGDSAMTNGPVTASTLSLSYTADPTESATLSSEETWKVTVTDANGASLGSNNVVATLDVTRATRPITAVTIAATATDTDVIAWNASSGTASAVIAAPSVTGGFGALSYLWTRVSADSGMTNGLTTGSSLSLSYSANPSEGATLSSTETWNVTVSDGYGAELASNNCVVTLDIDKGTEPITVVTIAATATDTDVIAWNASNGTASAVIAAPSVTGGFGTLSYAWSRVSGDSGMTNGSTTGSSLSLSYSANPGQAATLSSTETWKVTVSDGYGAELASNNCIVTLDIDKGTEPITVVTIAATATDTDVIAWNASSGTASTVIAAPSVTGGFGSLSYAWSRVSGDSGMTNGSTTGSSLSLSYSANPGQAATLSSTETWKVTVSDGYGAVLASNNCVVTLDVEKDTRPITAVTISSTASDSDFISWNASSGTASTVIVAPSVTGGYGTLSYAWSLVSAGSGMTNGSTTGSTLSLSYTANPSQSQTLSSSETWKVTVSDGYGAVLASNNCVVTLDIEKDTRPITAVSISSTKTDTDNIAYNVSSGTASAVIAAPSVTGGYGTLSYLWSRVSVNGSMTNSTTTGSSLTLTYNGSPAMGATVSSTETWKVTVSDGYGASLASGNCVVTLYVDRDAQPITNVSISGGTTTVNSTSSGQSKTANRIITPSISGGVAPYTYAWSQVSGAGLSNTSTTGSTLTLSKTGTAGSYSYNSGSETWKVTVTDSNQSSSTSNNAAVTCRIYGNYSTGTGTSCLMSNAEVAIIGHTSNSGTICTLADVEVGDEIISFNTPSMIDEDQPNWREWLEGDITDGEVGTTTVVRADAATVPVHYVINGLLKSTRMHPYMVKRDNQWQWINAEDLTVGDCLYGIDGDEIPITSVEFVNEPLDIVNIGAETTDTFFAGSLNGQLILNHNK